MDFWHLNQNKNKLIKTFVESILLYVLETWTIIGEAVRWHIHKIGNKSTKHQLETTIYTGTDLWKPPKGLRCHWDEKKLLHRSLSTCKRGNDILPFLSHIRKEEESHSAIWKHL